MCVVMMPLDLPLQARRFALFEAHLRRWQEKMNLVAPDSLASFATRHLLDSAQIWPLLPSDCRGLVDIGSGGGMPGLVLAILAAEQGLGWSTHLIEADQRKAIFLREACRIVELPQVRVHATRVEALPADSLTPIDVVTARACAPLERLLSWASPWLARGAVGLLPKGRDVDDEIAGLTQPDRWAIERHASLTDPRAVILRVRDVRA
jgi:16S rRNA (guanine527-N7)-methyltransferase